MEPPGLEEKILVTDGEYVWTDTWVDSHINIGFDTTGIFTIKVYRELGLPIGYANNILKEL